MLFRSGFDPVAAPVAVLSRIGFLSENRDLPPWMRVDELLRYTRAFYPQWDPAFAEEFGLWLNFPVTNQFNPANFALIGSATNLVTPANASFVRCQLVFQQPALADGSVLFDDVKLAAAGTTLIPVPISAARAGSNLNLAFATYLALPYQVNWKSSLDSPSWSVLTNLSGSGSSQTVSVNLQASARFYRVTRICN